MDALKKGWLNIIGHLLAQIFIATGQTVPFEGRYGPEVLEHLPPEFEGVFVVCLFIRKSSTDQSVHLTEAGVVNMLMDRMAKKS